MCSVSRLGPPHRTEMPGLRALYLQSKPQGVVRQRTGAAGRGHTATTTDHSTASPPPGRAACPMQGAMGPGGMGSHPTTPRCRARRQRWRRGRPASELRWVSPAPSGSLSVRPMFKQRRASAATRQPCKDGAAAKQARPQGRSAGGREGGRGNRSVGRGGRPPPLLRDLPSPPNGSLIPPRRAGRWDGNSAKKGKKR